MKTLVSFICSWLIVGFSYSQNIGAKLGEAVKRLEADDQMKSAQIGFCVWDQQSSKMIFEKNSKVGLAVASSQKVITSAASLEILGTDYRYKTALGYDGKIGNGTLNGNIYITGYGDPTLGSWRYNSTKEQVILSRWVQALQESGIKRILGKVICIDKNWDSQSIPGGWIWDDIGNYYGAGASALNWRENQYDLILQPGKKEGDKVNVISTQPPLYGVNLINELTAGKAGSGDNGYIYLPPYSTTGYVRGTVPAGSSRFTISGSVPNVAAQLHSVFIDELQRKNIDVSNVNGAGDDKKNTSKIENILTIWSPSLDSINYWFLKRSINLYGEALVKTLGYEKTGIGSTEAGINVIKNFWQENKIDPVSINIIDGSGLSPGNRVTPEALVKVLQYSRSRPWFSSFYQALPEINGIRMKSGSINGIRSFTGFVGIYTFSIVINNYNGSSADIVRKMYSLLDILKN